MAQDTKIKEDDLLGRINEIKAAYKVYKTNMEAIKRKMNELEREVDSKIKNNSN